VRRVLFALVAPLQAFFRMEAAGGILLMVAAALGVALANSRWRDAYHHALGLPVELRVGSAAVVWPLHHWINDALMTLFFLVAGMEIKRELTQGELRTFGRAVLPLLAAAGGMLAPALIYLFVTHATPASRGWGIPTATDIAFSLGVLTFVKGRVPSSLFVFLTALAIFDDLGAILVIALFYGADVHLGPLLVALAITGGLVALGRLRVQQVSVYAIAGVALWVALLRSGVHATLAGVILGLAMPSRSLRPVRDTLNDLDAALDILRREDDKNVQSGALAAIERHLESVQAPLDRVLHGVHPSVAYGIVPLFALANSGVTFDAVAARGALSPVSVGAFLGLVVGKPVGVFTATWLAVRAGISPRPTGASWAQVFGVAVMAGIGFTMSLFVNLLAFGASPVADAARIGVFAASLTSAVLGLVILRFAGPKRAIERAEEAVEVAVEGDDVRA
jgi:NhaA family Na+:H+ antiporter